MHVHLLNMHANLATRTIGATLNTIINFVCNHSIPVAWLFGIRFHHTTTTLSPISHSCTQNTIKNNHQILCSGCFYLLNIFSMIIIVKIYEKIKYLHMHANYDLCMCACVWMFGVYLILCFNISKQFNFWFLPVAFTVHISCGHNKN